MGKEDFGYCKNPPESDKNAEKKNDPAFGRGDRILLKLTAGMDYAMWIQEEG